MPSVYLELAATEEQVLAALRHTASVFGVALSDGPLIYNIDVPVEAATTPEQFLPFSDRVDPVVKVRVVVAPGMPTRVQLESHTPLFYLTSQQGFDNAAVVSLARTLRETVRAAKEGRVRPAFPAPSGELDI
jgi:hypothetical protein